MCWLVAVGNKDFGMPFNGEHDMVSVVDDEDM